MAGADPRAGLPHPDGRADARWHSVLAGDARFAPGLVRLRRLFRHLPSDPRCKLCLAPYAPPFGPLLGALGYGRWKKNPSLCGSCMRIMERAQGGAEVELSMLFADLRGSTEVAAGLAAGEYTRLLNGFYAAASRAITDHGGVVDKYLGDGVFALFVPGFTGPDHAAQALAAARAIMERTAAPPLPIGIGVHRGTAYVGVVGQAGDLVDFTALGEAVNLTERLSSAADGREILLSDAAAVASGPGRTGFVRRELALKGIGRLTTAWSERHETR